MELHFSEPWFHRIVQGGRGAAEDLLRKNSNLGDGTFLVRPSETFVGAYSLSFNRRGEVNRKRNQHGLYSQQSISIVTYEMIGPNKLECLSVSSLYNLE
jgi:hypothetical protein